MESFNMKHVLRWTPLKTSCNTTVLYSVQYQGDFERLISDTWLSAPECQQVPVPQCDLTLDLRSDSDYILGVRAECGSQLSNWSNVLFNRRNTTLMPPDIQVLMTGDALQVSIKKPPTSSGRVTVWRRDQEQQPVTHNMADEQEVLHIASLQEGAEYCVKAQVVLHTGEQSDFTDTHCVVITGPGAPAWKKPTMVTLAVVAMLSLLVALFWFIGHCRPDSCRKFFEKVPLPSSLVQLWKIDTRVIVPPTEPNPQEKTSRLQISQNLTDFNSSGFVLVQMDQQDQETELVKTFSQTETAGSKKLVPAEGTGSEHEVLLPPVLKNHPSTHSLDPPGSVQDREELWLLSSGSELSDWVHSGPDTGPPEDPAETNHTNSRPESGPADGPSRSYRKQGSERTGPGGGPGTNLLTSRTVTKL
ncbi:interleukin-20 receptor subunit beta [Austrofundulus limnaeus]|uniref:Interleukin-20 receptor subunit beta n=1 Tax=Austrofundulus limnaeus TaxID=52670 RepID=A0A2I4D282_AUSLI|nr:PREDICTED: interleukin-20 receptor subunit beta-like [Austrofundulus limnaeus]